MQVAQVMAEWQKLNFVETFELIRSVINRLNKISRLLSFYLHHSFLSIPMRFFMRLGMCFMSLRGQKSI